MSRLLVWTRTLYLNGNHFGYNSPMTRLLRLVAVPALLLVAGCSGSGTAPQPAPASTHDIDITAMDTSVAPGDDFFRYANGGWLKKTEIPPDRAAYGIWSTLADLARNRTHDLFEQLAAAKATPESDEQRIGD